MGRPPRIRRDQILDTARRLFAAKGFAAATLADIAGELGVTPAALLRHVDSKDALFAEAMRSGEVVEPPACIRDLATTPADADPRIVLRRIAEEFVPFAKAVIGSHIVVAMHANARRTSLILPFDPQGDSPPRRGFPIVADYFRRAAAAGRLRVRDPRAAALLFMGSLQGFVLFHHVLKMPPVCTLSEYIDTLIDLWCDGAIVEVGGTRGRKTKRARATRRAAAGGSGHRRGGDVRLSARTQAGGDRPLRNTRGTDGQRRLARRRPRDTNARR
jgi:AcrR family transcriptional regulator